MVLENLGYNSVLEQFRRDNGILPAEVGRITAEHRGGYLVRTATEDFAAEITGNMRFFATEREAIPVVGDWVALAFRGAGLATIRRIFPRYSLVKRQAAGEQGKTQPVAANVDYAFIVQAVDGGFNINRLERYLAICHAAGVGPLIILSKTDLVDQQRLVTITEEIAARIKDVPVIPLSNSTRDGYDAITGVIAPGKTYCILGASGVGKSTLSNNLAGRTVMRTEAVSPTTNKGRHTTSHRVLIVLEGGGILIDNPGMREVGIIAATNGSEETFAPLVGLSRGCKFRNCTHTTEVGCRVLEAVARGEIAAAAYENFQKMEKEKAHFAATLEERKRRDRKFGKMLKNYKKGSRGKNL